MVGQKNSQIIVSNSMPLLSTLRKYKLAYVAPRQVLLVTPPNSQLRVGMI